MAHVIDRKNKRDLREVTNPLLIDYYAREGYEIDGQTYTGGSLEQFRELLQTGARPNPVPGQEAQVQDPPEPGTGDGEDGFVQVDGEPGLGNFPG